MKLRDHLDIAILIARLKSSSPVPEGQWTQNQRVRFWNHVSYLEHLWNKLLDGAKQGGRPVEWFGLLEEILVTRFLLQIVNGEFQHRQLSASEGPSTSVDPLQSITCLVDQFLDAAGSPVLDRKCERLERRLNQWRDLLESGRRFESTGAASRAGKEIALDLVPEPTWQLMQLGIANVISSRSVEDPVRSSVHRIIQEQASILIPPTAFLKTGEVKAGWRTFPSTNLASWS